MRFFKTLSTTSLALLLAACGAAEQHELGAQPGAGSEQPGPFWVVVEQEELGLSPKEPERWSYDSQGYLLKSEEWQPCRCVEFPRVIYEHSYAPGEIITTIDRDADGSIQETLSYNFDGEGRISRFRRSLEARVHTEREYEYDEFGRLRLARDEAGRVERVRRDEAGRIVERYDGEVLQTTWAYDDQGRIIRKTDTAGYNNYEFAYNALGQMVEQRSFRPGSYDHKTYYGYDEAGRLVSQQAFEQGRSETLVSERSFTFDEAGLLILDLSVDHRSGARTEQRWSYDEAGALQRAERWQNGTLRYAGLFESRPMRTGDVEVLTTVEGAEAPVQRTVYRKLDSAPIEPPQLPRLRPEHPRAPIPRSGAVLH